MSLDDFKEIYINAEWLETRGGCERWSNGLEEGSEHESVWFDCNGEECQSPDLF